MRKIYFLLSLLVIPFLAMSQVPNVDMESWHTAYAGDTIPVSIQVPDGWYTSDSLIISLGQRYWSLISAPSVNIWQRQVFQEASIKHSGSYAAKIMTALQDSFITPGVISNAVVSLTFTYPEIGISSVTLSGGTPVSVKPTSVSAWVRYVAGNTLRGTPGIDSGRFTVQVLSYINGMDSIIGTADIMIAPTGNNWINVTDYIVYNDNIDPVDTMRIAFASSNSSAGADSSTLYVDDISMTSIPNPVDHTGIRNVPANDPIKIYPNPSYGILNIEVPAGEELSCKLYSINGQALIDRTLTPGDNALDVSLVPEGMYFYNIYDKSGSVMQRGKVVVCN